MVYCEAKYTVGTVGNPLIGLVSYIFLAPRYRGVIATFTMHEAREVNSGNY